jgi:PleD family two-component response regulator
VRAQNAISAALKRRAGRRVAHPMLEMDTKNALMHSPKKVLLIDREPGVTRIVRQALEKAGKYLVREEHDNFFSIDAARLFEPDLILLDTPSNSLDGQTLERQIQSDPLLGETPLVHLSSLKSENQIMSGGILSGYSFFAGPVGIDEILGGVEQLLFGKD